MEISYSNYKIKTEVNGLDALLFGGLQLQTIGEKKPLIIVLRGELGTSRALLAMQLLHGITKSLKELNDKSTNGEVIEISDPIFYTQKKSKSNISDMLVDTVISKCINKIIEENAKSKDSTNPQEKGKWPNDLFCQTIFDIPPRISLPLNVSKLDYYLSQEIIVYNSRTNALHVALPTKALSENLSDMSLVIRRRYDNLGDYCPGQCPKETEEKYPTYLSSKDLPKNLSDEFFIVKIWDEEDEGELKQIRHSKLLQKQRIPCLVLDKDYANEDSNIRDKALVVIYVENKDTDLEQYNADMIIEMRNHTDPKTEYLCHQLAIIKSTLQDTAHGWHQYKKRDYGIEVYPSAHVILQRRRHMPKGVLRAQMDILSETYQHYIDSLEEYKGTETLLDFINRSNSQKEDNLKQLYDKFAKTECSEDILENILIGSGNNKSQVTAIIGPPNSYKRHLTLGSTFSACCRGEHTLNILLDKEDNIILQKMICPATIFKDPKEIIKRKCESCIKCYACIHFKEIRMGCISSDEFFYYLIQQLRVSKESTDKNRQIRRIVIDDLQKIEFCFPMIDKDSLFLTGLISICKDYDIDLFILCDKYSDKVEALRAQADNVICTERTPDYDLNIYIEHYFGPSSPSHIWGCHITDIKDLFYCDTETNFQRYRLNSKNIKSFSTYSMEDYWKK